MGDTFTISLPNGDAFCANSDENLLASAQRAHWLVRYGCRNGNCEACAARLLDGGVSQRGRNIGAPADILLCLCQPRTDLRIELPGSPQHGSVQQSQRRYVRVVDNVEIAPHAWRVTVALPAGRQSAIYPGQYALLENTTQPQTRLYVDVTNSTGRTLSLLSEEQQPLSAGAYVHLRFPLGYCYPVAGQTDALILFEAQHLLQARQLQTVFAAQSVTATMLEIKNGEIPKSVETKLNSGIYACATMETARVWYETLLENSALFSEFRCDDAIWRRWRIQRQDDNGNRFTVASGLSENAARIKVAEMESHGHKQLYWTEPIM